MTQEGQMRPTSQDEEAARETAVQQSAPPDEDHKPPTEGGYEPPSLVKFERLESLIVSGE